MAVNSSKVDAFLVHWNAPEWCAESVDALVSSTNVRVTVTIVNNGGHLDLPSEVNILELGKNIGFTGGANIGLSSDTSSPYLFIGCHDIRLEPVALSALIDLLNQDPGLGIVGPALNGVGGTEHDLDWISGAGMLIRRAVVDVLRFDERFGSYVEDVDFCYRARDLGWRVGRAGGAIARTRGSVDEDKALVLMHANTVVFFCIRGMWRSAAKRYVLLLKEAYANVRAHSWRTARLYCLALGLAIYRLFAFYLRGSRGLAPSRGPVR